MRLAIGVPVHNAPECVRQLVQGLDETVPDVPVVFVDDASDAETHNLLQSYVGEVRTSGRSVDLLVNSDQQLFTRTANRAIRHLYRRYDPDAIAVVNTDVVLSKGWLAALVRPMESDLKVGIVGYPNEPTGEKPDYRAVRPPDYITGHCLLLRVEMLRQIGVFCETDTDGRHSPELAQLHGQAHIGSDRILSWRASAAGWRTLYCNLPLIRHLNGRSWGHRLDWLASFRPKWSWEPCDTLEGPIGVEIEHR